jgi:hypothetical protein
MENKELEMFKSLIPDDVWKQVFDSKELEKKEQIEKDKKLAEKMGKAIELHINNEVINIWLKKHITPETRHKLRQIVKDYPRNKYFLAIERLKISNPEITTSNEMFNKVLELNPGINEKSFMEYLRGVPDDDFEVRIEIFFLKYFQNIISMDSNSKLLIETPVELDGRINGIWNTIDLDTVIECVGFFRKKLGF